uniref:Non-structural protein NS2 n=1 Tax=Japanaut virus TaxID=2547358 RepID=A0A482AC73_9REOV|nr:NS2 [Japanaut virus]
MEAKSVNKVFTKNVCILDRSGKSVCGMVAQANRKPYCLVRTGRVFGFKAIESPPPKSYVLEVHGVGAYRISDGMDNISLMITECGVEATTGRWEEWKFEVVNATPMAVVLNLDGKMVDAEVKYAKGMGLIKAYTKNEVDRKLMPELPGLSQSRFEVRELRAKLREERDAQVQDVKREEENAWTKITQRIDKLDLETKKWAEVGGGSDEEEEKQEAMEVNTVLEEITEEEEEMMYDDEGTSKEEEAHSNHITSEYVEKVSALIKKPCEKTAGFASAFPKSTGEFEKVLKVLKVKWEHVPLYDVSQELKTYRLMGIGSARRATIVSRGLSQITLPAGE